MKTTSILLALAVSLTGLTASVSAKENTKDNAFSKALKGVPVAEMPAKAAKLVRQARAQELQTTTIGVVKAAVDANPVSAPLTVGAISKAMPDVAPLAAGTAAALQPKQAGTIARAAAAAAPLQAGKIVQAVCREVPSEYRTVAIAVAEVVPSAARDVLAGVAAANPALQRAIEQRMNVQGATVVGVLDQAAASLGTTAVASSAGPRPPSSGGPFIPLTGTVTNATTSTTSTQPPGGRDYSAP